MLAGRRCCHQRWLGDLLIMHYHGQHSLPSMCSRSKVPIAPMGKWLTCLPRLTLAHNCGRRSGQLQSVRAAETFNVSHRPDGIFTCVLRLCSQGGGVYIGGGTVTFSSCAITGNTANLVRHHWQNFPSPPWETHVLLVFTGRRCPCQFRHHHNDVLLDHRQHSFWMGAFSCSKVPIAPMGFSHVLRLCLQGGGVLIFGGTVTFSSCTITGNTAMHVRAHAHNFPLPRWERPC